MQKKKLLVIDAKNNALPFIIEAKKLGFYVVTTGNNSTFIGHRYADEYIYCDFSDYEAMIRLCEENDICATSCGMSDPASYPSAYLGEYFGWKGHDSLETVKTLHNKDKFKEFTKENGIQAPVSTPYSDLEAALADIDSHVLPVIVKPVDCAGGQGISVIRSREEYAPAITAACERSVGKRIVVEPYLEGTQHSFSAFLVDQKVVNYCSWDDLTYEGSYKISKGCAPASYENPEYVNGVLCREIEKIAKKLHLVDGLFHLQCIVKDGEPYIIEVMRRAPGHWTTVMASNASGINWDQWIVMAESGMDCHGIPRDRQMQGFWGYYAILGSQNGIVRDVIIEDEIRGNIWQSIRWEDNGYEITNHAVEEIGLVQLWFSSRVEMMDKMNRIDDLIRVVY